MEVAGRIELTTISAVSPSLAELLRFCGLRAGLSKANGANELVLGNPKAWLGTAYHEVMAATANLEGIDIDTALEEAWDRAIVRQYERARAHALDRRFGTPERWPGYYLVRSMALMRG